MTVKPASHIAEVERRRSTSSARHHQHPADRRRDA